MSTFSIQWWKDILLNEIQLDDKQPQPSEPTQTIAIYPGSFKPPINNQVDTVKQLLSKSDQVVILISPEEKNGVTADESVMVWQVYKEVLGKNIELKITSGDPIKEAWNTAKNNPDTKFIIVTYDDKLPELDNVQTYKIHSSEDSDMNAFKQALETGDASRIKNFIPNGVSEIDIMSILQAKPDLNEPEEKHPLDVPTPAIDSINAQGLQEIQLGREPSPYQEYIRDNEEKVEAAAQYFNYPISDLQYAFFLAKEVVVSDDIWKKLENSDSYNVTSLEEVIKLANKQGVDVIPYIKAIKNEEQLPFPLIFNYNPDKYYLVGGNIVLSLYKVLNVIPVALMATLDLQDKEDISKQEYDLKRAVDEIKVKSDNLKTYLSKFMKYAAESLRLQTKPEGLILSKDNNKSRTDHTFGHFNPETKKIWLYVKNRNIADILRTLAHELVHLKQAEEGRIYPGSGETGSPIENEANATAGVLLRNFGKENEGIYESLKKYGDYLFGDKRSGVKIGWYDEEKEIDTPSEKKLYDILKKYADSESAVYSTVDLDALIPLFKIIKKQYPEIGDPKITGETYLYRGTSIDELKLEEMMQDSKTEDYNQGVIIMDQTYSSRRIAQSWSLSYFVASGFAYTTADRYKGTPVILRAKAKDMDLYFNPDFMDKLSVQIERETFNIVKPVPVDIMVPENYEDEFEDIESGYLHTKLKKD
jgi:hypothetical protein